MSGRKRFDEEKAVEAAMLAFWQKGYEATSLCDLERATGLNKSSLYNTFESKEALFQRCLARYASIYGEAMLRELDAPDFRSAVENLFGAMLARFDNPTLPGGCLSTMTAMDPVSGNSEISARVARAVAAMHSAFAARCERAKAEGVLPSDTDCDGLAALLTAVARGITVLDRSGSGSDTARDAVRGARSMIDGLVAKAAH